MGIKIQTPYNALKSLFQYYNDRDQRDVVGDESIYTIIYPRMIYDIDQNYDGECGYIAPESGIYLFRFHGILQLSGNQNNMYTLMTSPSYIYKQNVCNPKIQSDSRNQYGYSHYETMLLRQGDRVITQIYVGNSHKDVTILGTAFPYISTSFAGYMIHST